MPGIYQGYADVLTSMPWWILGQLTEGGSNNEIRTAINAYPQAVEVTTVTVTDTGVDSQDISIVINGVTVTSTSGVGQTLAQIGAALAVAINAEPRVRGQVVASFDTATLTLTGLTPGVPITVTEADGALSAVTEVTASASAAVIEFGRAVVYQGRRGTDELVAKCASGLFTAQVITVTPTFISLAVLTASVYEVRGAERHLLFSVSESSASSLAVTLAALLASLNTGLTAASAGITVTGGVTNLVFTATKPGLEFDVDMIAGDEGASVPTAPKVFTTGPSVTTSFHRAFRGVAVESRGQGAVTIGGNENQYPANSALAYVRRTEHAVVVESAEAIVVGDRVYVETGVTADNGKFYNTSGATRLAISRQYAVWELKGDTNTGDLAALRLTM